MQHSRNDNLVPNARKLRKSMTKEERHLWFDFLRYCRPRFRRQEIIGNYIADFCCYSAKLIIELDGSQHLEQETMLYDARRTAYFETAGFRVIRYYNTDINQNFEGVCQDILAILESYGLCPMIYTERKGSP